ncbi:hypothetical protein LTR64_005568 [Lithohypha guttulata]|uniref:uncharacterized protein n=1 Tax=Lithohypha guttulata TaxID=1690604 RepID=UPI002DE0A01B|nr:hypothetical protein LTR51_002638 [Lithohypha guttulata]
MYSLLVLGALTSSVIGQVVTFSNTTFTAPVTVGSVWPISFGAGNRQPVSIAFGNSSYAFQVVDGLTAPGTYNWNVAVPVNVVEGMYQLALVQGESDPVYSPPFSLVIPPEAADSTTDAPTTTIPFPTGAGAPMMTVTAIYLPPPMNITNNFYQTFIYYDEDCGCHQTSTCPPSEVPTATSMTTVTYSAVECGCTTTIEAPAAETVIPMAATMAPATNVPVAPTTAPAPPPAAVAPAATTTAAAPVPTTSASTLPAFTGSAYKLAGTSWAFLALAAALVLA